MSFARSIDLSVGRSIDHLFDCSFYSRSVGRWSVGRLFGGSFVCLIVRRSVGRSVDRLVGRSLDLLFGGRSVFVQSVDR